MAHVREDNWKDSTPVWHFYELKPRIVSVGGLIRQLRATMLAAKQAGCRAFGLYAVAYEDDPKLSELRQIEEIPVVTVRRDSQNG